MINLLEQLTELRETLMLSSLIRDIIKDTDEQPDEDIHRVRSGRVPSAGVSVAVELRCITLPVCTCSATPMLSEPCHFVFLWRLPYIAMID